MTKLGTVFWLGLVLASGFATYKVKYAVQNIDDQLTRARKQTVAERQEIRVLTAEWTYLTQPERLAGLNGRFLQLAPITTAQLRQRIADIPLRAAPAAPEQLVAANPTPPALPAAAAPLSTAASPAAAAPAAALPVVAANPPASASPVAAKPLPVRTAALRRAAPLRFAKAEPARLPRSLDALIAQIAEAR